MGRKFKVDINRKPFQLAFTRPMECFPVTRLPEGPEWSYEVKLDGFRAQAMHMRGGVSLISRNGKDLGARFPDLLPALAIAIPVGSVVDGELVALDERGHPSFQLLQNAGGVRPPLAFCAFDLLTLSGRDLTARPLAERRTILRQFVRPSESVQISEVFDIKAMQMLNLVRKHGLEGVVAKRTASRYEPGERSGAWAKLRMARAQEFVIGGFTRGSHAFDELLIGYYRAGQFLYCAQVRDGFVPATKRAVHSCLFPLITKVCPFSNLPEPGSLRGEQSLNAERMQACTWIRPELVGQFGFLEWTSFDQPQHVRFLGLRDDKDPRAVVREI